MDKGRRRLTWFFRAATFAVIFVIVFSFAIAVAFSKVRTYDGDGRPIQSTEYVPSSYISSDQDVVRINMSDLDEGRLSLSLRSPGKILSNYSAVYVELIDLSDGRQLINRTIFSHVLFDVIEFWIPKEGDYRLVVVKNDMHDDPVSIMVVYENDPAIFVSDLGPWILPLMLGIMVILSVTFILRPKKEEDAIPKKDRKWVGWSISSVSICFGIASAVFTLAYPPFFFFCIACPYNWIVTIPLTLVVGIVIFGITVIAFLTGVTGIARKRGRPLAAIGLVLSLLTPTIIFLYIVFINFGILLTEVLFE